MSIEARQALAVAFDNRKPAGERLRAARRAAELDGQSMVLPLALLMGQIGGEERTELGAILAELHAVDVLSIDLRAGDSALRLRAAQLLGLVRDLAAAPLLIDALTDPDPSVREAAASALRKMKSPRAFSALARSALSDPHPDVRGACAQALGELDDPRALEILELATRREEDTFVVVLIERSILRFMERIEGRSQEEFTASHPQIRLPSVFGLKLPPKRASSSAISSPS